MVCAILSNRPFASIVVVEGGLVNSSITGEVLRSWVLFDWYLRGEREFF